MIPNPTESTPLPPGVGTTQAALHIDAYCRLFPGERERIAPLLRALHAGEALRSRKHPGGHLTASGLLICGRRLLTVHHPHLRRWLQPGGHLEHDELPQQAALRETREETGVDVRLHRWHARHPCPVDIDVHAIPANPARGELAEPGLPALLDKLDALRVDADDPA